MKTKFFYFRLLCNEWYLYIILHLFPVIYKPDMWVDKLEIHINYKTLDSTEVEEGKLVMLPVLGEIGKGLVLKKVLY